VFSVFSVAQSFECRRSTKERVRGSQLGH